MENLLEVKNLSKSYGDFQLKDISFEIPKGVIVGLIGENGSGKTTIINSILNLIEIDRGEIKIFGQDHIKSEYEVKEKISVVLDNAFFPDFLDLKNVKEILRDTKASFSSEVYDKYVEYFKLAMNKPLAEFSKGMNMKAKIAVCLSTNPSLLLLDEPTSGLDPIVRDEILEIFLDILQDENRSILISSHITSDLDKIADYILFIHEGQVLLYEAKDVLEDEYGIVKVGLEDFAKINKDEVISHRKNAFGYSLLIRNRENFSGDFDYIIEKPSLEDIMIFFVRGEK